MVPPKDSSAWGVDCYPLSPMQQGMLFHSLEAANPGVDVEQVVGELHEEVVVGLFERAWREVVARHAILRTSFHWADGAEPRQVVHPPSEVRLGFSYEEFGSEHEARRGLEEYLSSDRRVGFRLEAAPLLRVALIRGGERHYWWVCTFHHLLLDGRAMVVVFREALELHDALAAGRPCELPPARPYRAYIDWLQTLDWTRAEKFWRAQLQGFTLPTVLPIDRPGHPGGGEAGGHGELGVRLSEELTARLRATARRHDATINTLLQAGWALLLSRYSGEQDVIFGAVRACRHIPVDGAGSIVGLFINTVPVRATFDRAMGIGACLQQLREQWVNLRDHEHTPLMRIQQWSEVAPGRPLFETLFNYQEPSWDAALRGLGGVWATRDFDIRSQPNYPLAVDAYGGAGIVLKLLYDRGRFADDAIAQMIGHYRALLEAMCDPRERKLADLPLLTPREQERILVEWNRTAVEYPRDQCVHEVVARQAAAAPERLAASDTNTSITYGALNARANQLAHRLRKLGVGREARVAVCMERSVEMLIAWLGVLKAGGAFVPLDPHYPKERLAFQLGDCGALVLLTQPHLRRLLPAAPAQVKMVDVTADGAGLAHESAENPPEVATARSLAYVIYTSGSTGQPKGVQIEHGALMNLVTWHQRTYRIAPDDRATQLASPAFDASVWEVWPYMAAGAAIFVPTEETRIAPAALLRWMAAKKITVSFLPTPLAEAVLAERWPDGMVLRALLTGGDKLKRAAPAGLPCALVNHYGPTESTVVATWGEVAREGGEGNGPTIGRPIANTRVYVLDAQLRPVPVGVPGELCIGGESLARGYLNRPELDAEKFIPDPFAETRNAKPQTPNSAPRARLYRTGDLVRWRADGELEFLGRIDGQVKIRGCRIELGEVEAALQRHASVREALVLARPDANGQPQLVAYVRSRPDAAASAQGLAAHLRDTLPAYMVPAAFVVLDAWPLTSNGKIDRKALPAPPTETGSDAGAAARPVSANEELVARTWADVLGREGVGRHDNFFEIGGHSLLAAQVISRLNAALGGGLSVRSIFDHPTVAELARELALGVERNAAPRKGLPLVRRRASRTAELELVQPN